MERDTFGFLEGIIICEQKFLYGLVGHKLKKGKKKEKKTRGIINIKSLTHILFTYIQIREDSENCISAVEYPFT